MGYNRLKQFTKKYGGCSLKWEEAGNDVLLKQKTVGQNIIRCMSVQFSYIH